MIAHYDLSDTTFERAFEMCTLDPAVFTHEAHVRLAWIHIKKCGMEKAIENMNGQLIRFVTALGARDKYNQTVTTAAVKAVNHFIGRSKADNFKDFIQEFPKLKTNFKDLMNAHYDIDIFPSATTRSKYIEPQLLSFE